MPASLPRPNVRHQIGPAVHDVVMSTALDYSEKALAILKVTLKNESKELEPFLDDNRLIRERLGRR